MKLLVITQKVDADDDVLGFFHRWIEEFAERFDRVAVVCLEKGTVNFRKDIEVVSLGKEQGVSRFVYLARLFRYIWTRRREYDAVFVHMNQEYVLLGGLFWRLLGKKIGLWRNHPHGTWLTRIAVWLSHVVFCTSPYSYTASFSKTLLMPVGIDTEEFRPIGSVRVPDSLVFFGRMSPIKKPEILIHALSLLKQKNLLVAKTAFIGNAKKSDAAHLDALKEKVREEKLDDYVEFRPGIPHREAPAMLSQFEAYINTTPTGSMDKAIFEAMACETLVVASNKALAGDIPDYLLFKEESAESLSYAIEKVFLLSATERRDLGCELRRYVIERHSLSALMDRLYTTFTCKK